MPAPPLSSVRFGGLDIAYDERVLEPRAWTLLQSEWAAELSSGAPAGAILELCSGAGHIGLAAAGVTGRPLVQVDSNPAAAELARMNAAAAGMEAVEVRCVDLQRAVGEGESFPLILADPPYLPSEAVGQHPGDPGSAIDGGPDGMELLRACVAEIDRALMADGAALVQVYGEAQGRALEAELPAGLRLAAIRTHDPQRAVVLLTRVNDGEDDRSD